MTAFNSLNGQYLPGTTSKSWTSFFVLAPPPGSGFVHLIAMSKDEAFFVHLFDYRSAALASDSYRHPVNPYGALAGPTGVHSPSRNISLLTTCARPLSKATCFDGVGTLVLRSNIVILVYWVSHALPANQPDTARLPTVTPYVRASLSMLSRVGLAS